MNRDAPSISWQSRAVGWLASAEIPLLPACLLVFVVLSLIFTVAAWAAGGLPFGQISVVGAQNAFWAAFILYFSVQIHRSSTTALAGVRNEMEATAEEIDAWAFQFQMVSASAGWISTAITLGFLVLGTFAFSSLFPQNMTVISPYGLFVFIMYAVIYSFATVFFGSVVKKIRMIGSVYSTVPNVDLFNHDWIGEFARLTLVMAIPFLLANVLTYIFNIAVNPDYAAAAFFFTLNSLMAAGIFLYPLWGIHQRLVREKKKLKRQTDENISRLINHLTTQLSTNDVGTLESMTAQLTVLRDMETMIDRESTWPWDTGTLRNFVSALVLPIALFILQRILLILLSL